MLLLSIHLSARAGRTSPGFPRLSSLTHLVRVLAGREGMGSCASVQKSRPASTRVEPVTVPGDYAPSATPAAAESSPKTLDINNSSKFAPIDITTSSVDIKAAAATGGCNRVCVRRSPHSVPLIPGSRDNFVFSILVALKTLALEAEAAPQDLLAADDAVGLERWLRSVPSASPGSGSDMGSGESGVRDANMFIPTRPGALSEEHILIVACRAGAVKCVDTLLRAHANVNHSGTNGMTVCSCRARASFTYFCVGGCHPFLCPADMRILLL